MAVLASAPHIDVSRGDASVEEKQKYDHTYKFGRTTIHVVAPPPLTHERREQILNEFYAAGWAILRSVAEAAEKEDK